MTPEREEQALAVTDHDPGAQQPAAARAVVPPHRPRRDAGARPGRPTPSRAGTAPAGPAGRRPPTAPSTPREVDRLARAVALLWLEVESGRRTPATVAHLLDHGLWQRLRHRWVRGGPPGHLVRLLVYRNSATLCDAVAIVARGQRTGAITFRLCRRDDGWCVIEAGLPELDGAR